MAPAAAGQFVRFGAVNHTGGADCGKLGKPAKTARHRQPRRQTVTDHAGKILRQTRNPPRKNHRPRIPYSGDRTEAWNGSDTMKPQIAPISQIF